MHASLSPWWIAGIVLTAIPTIGGALWALMAPDPEFCACGHVFEAHSQLRGGTCVYTGCGCEKFTAYKDDSPAPRLRNLNGFDGKG